MSCSTSALDGTGQIVPVEDPAALAEAVDALLADPNWRRQLGLAARQRVVEEYSLQRSIEGIISLWRKLGTHPLTGLPASRKRRSRRPGHRRRSVDVQRR